MLFSSSAPESVDIQETQVQENQEVQESGESPVEVEDDFAAVISTSPTGKNSVRRRKRCVMR